jgi:hypothetical protein
MAQDDNCNDFGFLRFQLKGKGKNSNEYGSIQKSLWIDGTCKSETTLWLGKVLNKDEMIFKSRQNGIFRFTPPDTITPLTPGEIEFYGLSVPKKTANPLIGEALSGTYEQPNCLSFGGVYVASEILRKSMLTNLFTEPFADLKNLQETVMSLILYKLTQAGASMHIKSWWDETYAHYLYPEVKLDSPRLSECLNEIGKDKYCRIFF